MTSPRLHIDANGIAWVTFDDPDSKVNVISSASMGELDRSADTLWNRHPKGVVLISAKPNIFIAGANPAEAHPIIFRYVEDARAANPDLKIIVADPRRAESAEIADLHGRVRSKQKAPRKVRGAESGLGFVRCENKSR